MKDRIGLRMLEEVEKAGKCKPGDVLIEASSGNTGWFSIAILCRYHLRIFLFDRYWHRSGSCS